jgi:hypothetical protein
LPLSRLSGLHIAPWERHHALTTVRCRSAPVSAPARRTKPRQTESPGNLRPKTANGIGSRH